MNIEWVEPLFLLDDEAKRRYSSNRQADMIAVVRTSEIMAYLEPQANEVVCDGPGCIWCECGHEHPFTASAQHIRTFLNLPIPKMRK